MRNVSACVLGLLIATAATVAPDETPPRRIKVYVHGGGNEAKDRGARLLVGALREAPAFQIVREPRDADLFLEASSWTSDTPPELSGQSLPPQPCHVMVSHTSLFMLPGSISTQAPTCVDAARSAIRGLAAQLLRRPEPMDSST